MNLIDFDHNFFGRRHILDVLKKRVLGLKEGYRQNVALVGSRSIGKSCILKRFILDHDDPTIILVYLDLESRDFSSFTLQLTKSLIYHYLKSERLPLHDDLKLLCEEARSRIPQTVALVDAIMILSNDQKHLETYHGLLSLPEMFSHETGKSVVLIFDEFQQLESFPLLDVFQELGKRIMTQKNCLYIVSSSFEEQANTILSEKLSLLFGNFETLKVSPFDFSSGQSLIDRNIGDLRIGLNLKNFIVDFTGGHPFYINLLCQELISLSGVHRQSEIYAPIISQAIENVVFNPWGVISRHFDLAMSELCRGKVNNSVSSVLIALAEGKHKVQDLADSLKLKPSFVTQRISQLQAADIIEKNGNYYHIKDKLFRYWIKYVFERRLRAVDLEPGRQRKHFKEEIAKAVNDFQMIARKDLSTRIVDLLHKFDCESFSLCGRRYKLSSFREVESLKLSLGPGKSFDAIRAQGEEGLWLIVVKKDPLHDNDLHGIVQEIKKLNPRPQRSVIVSLNGLDDNAKIRALQEKLWIWNEEELNTLMHLYDEPFITTK